MVGLVVILARFRRISGDTSVSVNTVVGVVADATEGRAIIVCELTAALGRGHTAGNTDLASKPDTAALALGTGCAGTELA